MDGWIKSGKYFYDTQGKLVQAHGGQIVPYRGKFYWFGEDKTGIVGRNTGESTFHRWHNGVRLYVSEDLAAWEDRGIVIVNTDGDKFTPFHPANITERPHVIYNPKTKKFVMWAKECGPCDYSVQNYRCGYAVAVSDTIDGQYRFLRRENVAGGDFDLFCSDGKAFLAGERPHDAFCLYELSEDYTSIVSEREHFTGMTPPFLPEAPCYLERNVQGYFVCSHTTGYFPNPAFNIRIRELSGTWERSRETFRGDYRKNSFNSQISCIFRVPDSDLYVALADRWLVDLPPAYPDPVKLYNDMFHGDRRADGILTKLTEQNTSLATYCFYVVSFDENGEPYIEWRDEWKLSEELFKRRHAEEK